MANSKRKTKKGNFSDTEIEVLVSEAEIRKNILFLMATAVRSQRKENFILYLQCQFITGHLIALFILFKTKQFLP